MNEIKQISKNTINNIFLNKFSNKDENTEDNGSNNESNSSSEESDSIESTESNITNQTNNKAINKTYNEADIISFFSSKELCYYKTIDRFFKACSKDKIQKMLEIIDGQSEISLRVLDWFVTRYSKRKLDFTGPTNNANNMEIFDVHISYKSQLKSYKKRYFDPFRRRKKFYYHYDTNNKELCILTTLGQLNFFRWAISNKIIDYVETNKVIVLKAMNGTLKEEKKKTKVVKTKKEKDIKDNKNVKETKDKEIKDATIKNEIENIKNAIDKTKLKTEKSTKKNINIKATKTIDTENEELQLVLSFD